MTTRCWLFSVACFLALSASAWANAMITFYVAPNGDDNNPGAESKPFASIAKARQAVRTVNKQMTGDIVVVLRGGVYPIDHTIVFGPKDSGSDGHRVIYRAQAGETPIISGGTRLQLDWKPYRNGIMRAAVPPDFRTDQLFANGVRQPMARYPNLDPNQPIFHGYAADAIRPQRIQRWADPRGGFIHALHEAEWGSLHFLITGKKADGTLAYEGGWQMNRSSGMHERFRFVENVFEELDSPGEWFLDRNTNTLYYKPPDGLNLATAEIEAVRLRQLVEFRAASQAPVRRIVLQGLTFRHTARTFMDTKEPLLRSDWKIYRGGALFFTGSEDCTVENCLLDLLGGNAVFVSNYNRRFAIRGCHIARVGGNGVAFIGDPGAVRNPLMEYEERMDYKDIDKTPGPKTDNYPADCLVEDCLIHETGCVEKQTAPIEIAMSQGITVRHCSLYDVPRAGINIGDGCWGGHLVEFCDVFDTVRETGDHGAFNSWGRDRFWQLKGIDLNGKKEWDSVKALPCLDAVKPTVLRNSRWRCDRGWDIDLDDGSSNYHIYNNVCLSGGIKNREGFCRTVENNVIVNNGFHPHVWYNHSEDVVRRNIMWSDGYLPAGGMPGAPWGKEMDLNLIHRFGATTPKAATQLARQSQRDAHSLVGDATFVDPASGDFHVKQTSPAIALGFVNFPMGQFGVRRAELKAMARTPALAKLAVRATATGTPVAKPAMTIWQAGVRDISGLGDRSAHGLPDESGVLLLDVPVGSLAAGAGLQKDDVIVACNGQRRLTVRNLRSIIAAAAGQGIELLVIRQQKQISLTARAGGVGGAGSQ